ncbi:MAG: DUF2953 domain-containing protein [Clostridia bacterium]|nr:DUF2953 domain-containing protein [Clostridia bacterium]
MIVLKIILWILAAILVLLCIPVFARFEYDGELKVCVRVLFIPFRVYPKEEFENNKIVRFIKRFAVKNKDPLKPTDSANKPAKKKQENSFTKLVGQHGFSGAVALLVDTARLAVGSFGRVLKNITVDRFDLDVTIADEDAAETALSYGKWCAVIYPAASLVLRSVRRYKKNINVNPDFTAQQSTFKADVKIHLYPLAMVGIAIAFFAKMLFRQIKKTVSQKVAENLNAANNAN